MSRKMFTMLMSTVVCCLAAATAWAQPKFTRFPIAIADTNDRTIAISGAYDGVNYMVGIQGDPSSWQHITAQLVSASGSLVGSRITVVGRTGGAPIVAFDGTNYFMAWGDEEGGGAVYGQLINTSGSLLGGALLIAAHTTTNVGFEGMAFGDTTYMVMYSLNDTLYGRRISKAGSLIGGAVRINIKPANGYPDIAIAFDGTNFLAAWCDKINRCRIYGQFISASGAMVGANFIIDSSSYRSDNGVAMAYDGARYLVGFHDQANTIDSSGWNLLGRFVTPAGAVGEKFTICDSTQNPHYPFIAYDGANYLITWINGTASLDTAYSRGRYFNATGASLDTTFTISGPLGGKVPFYTGLIYGGNQFLAYTTMAIIDTTGGDPFHQSDVYGAFIPKYIGVEGKPVEPFPIFGFLLGQNAPNPFTQSTKINYQLTKPGLVNLKVYNTSGQLVKTLVNAYRQPGSYTVNWDCTGNDRRKVTNGVYLTRLESQGKVATSKMVVVR